jgi:glyceraldehyde-3-phosphate dehydrogenase/erythrose-4-phosphate dehydrogenase
MSTPIGINGLGRIGRPGPALPRPPNLEIVAVKDITDRPARRKCPLTWTTSVMR